MKLAVEANLITKFLAERKIRARITGGFPAPAFSVYGLEFAPAEKFSKVTGALDELQAHLYSQRARAGLIDINDAGQRVVVRFSEQPASLEVSRVRPARLDLSTMPLGKLAPFQALAGVTFVTKSGQPITWNLADPGQPHALVAGMSGSGKSNLLESLIISLCHNTDPAALSVFVADGGNSSLLLTRRLLHTVDVATDAESVSALVHHVAGLVHQRKQASATGGQHRILLVVDELANLLAVMSRPQAQTLHQNLATIAAEGRKFGVHLLAGTQKPLAEVTGSLTKSNFAVRFVGAVASWQDAQTAADLPGTGAERLAGRGDFIMRAGMTIRRFQAPFVDGEIGAMRRVNLRWPAAANADHDLHQHVRSTGAPVHAGVATPVAPHDQPDPRTGAPVQMPLPRNRPPTPQEAAALRRLYEEHGSKNKTLAAAYGTKSPLLLSWLDQALAVN
jgi:S-DNA-T family DNA segregation ATPase FtsK/SpoIIIE